MEQGVTVTVGGMELTEGTPMELAVGEDIPWSISGGPPFKGVLVRLEMAGRDAPDATGALSTTSNVLRLADDTCVAPVTGITHNGNGEKTIAEGTLRVDEEADGELDITLVYVNNQTASEYAYTGYELAFVATVDSVAPATTEIDTPAPSMVDDTTAPSAVADTTPSPAPSPESNEVLTPSVSLSPVATMYSATSDPTFSQQPVSSPVDREIDSPTVVAPVEPTSASSIVSTSMVSLVLAFVVTMMI